MILFGASGHGKVILDILRRRGVEPEAFWDDQPSVDRLMGVEVMRSPENAQCEQMIVSVGNNRIRALLVERFKNQRFGIAIHPSALIGEDVEIGAGSVVMAGVKINSGARIGAHCILNTGCSIDHDCQLGDFVHISPQATLTGGVRVGKGTQIGAAAVAIPGISIGQWCIVGAGSVLIRDLDDFLKAVGSPARPIARTEL